MKFFIGLFLWVLVSIWALQQLGVPIMFSVVDALALIVVYASLFMVSYASRRYAENAARARLRSGYSAFRDRMAARRAQQQKEKRRWMQ